MLLTPFLIIFAFGITLLYSFEDFPWAIFPALFLIFSFGRRLNLMSKISKKYGLIDSIKCSWLFPIVDIANLYGMIKQRCKK
jgi:hypothetical protein